MSKPWNPDRQRRVRHSWPEGATAGLVLVAAACLALGVVIYQVAGPRDVVDKEAESA